MSATSQKPLSGGEFLIADQSPQATFTPEDLTDFQREFRRAVVDFAKAEISARTDAIENKDPGVMRGIIHQAGQLGFLGVDVPEEFGGSALTVIDSMMAFEAMGEGGNGSALVSLGAHKGIGTVPLLYFGNDEQRRKYLPKMVAGEMIAAYALTEAASGSDALGAKCKAELTPDGKHYRLNGVKRFITNAGFADIFTVFAKIEGKHVCFLVERSMPGVSVGKEEHKLGLKGSSTCDLILEDALVPVENLLGKIGRGHKIVFNTLNYGRQSLGAGSLGALKTGISQVLEYVAARKTGDKSLLDLDETRSKIADTVVGAWVGESMVYRTSGLMSDRLHGAGFGEAASKALEEYDIECSIVKVALSEMLEKGIDNGLQLFGGNGFIEEYPIARAYRDSRVNRIFEGTNEINRMLAVKVLAGRAMKGELDLIGSYEKAAAYVREHSPDAAGPVAPSALVDRLKEQAFFTAAAAREIYLKAGKEKSGVRGMVAELRRRLQPAKNAVVAASASELREALAAGKQTALFAIGTAVREKMQELTDEQQLLMQIADLLIWVYAMDSALVRFEKARAAGRPAELEEAAVRAYFAATLPKIGEAAVRVLSAVGKQDDARRAVAVVSAHYLKPAFDLVALRKKIGAAAAAAMKYPF